MSDVEYNTEPRSFLPLFTCTLIIMASDILIGFGINIAVLGQYAVRQLVIADIL